MEESDDSCAACGLKQTDTLNMTAESMMFYIHNDARCGHRFCKNCITDVFTHQGKRQFACEGCRKQGKNIMVKREKLSMKDIHETEVEKDIRVRRRVKAVYNKNEEDFPTVLDFKNYEEEIEDIIFNWVHDVNAQEMKKKVDDYEKQNYDDVVYNRSREMDENSILDRKIKVQNEQLVSKIREVRKLDFEAKKLEKEKARQLNEVMLGERDATDLNMVRMKNEPAEGAVEVDANAVYASAGHQALVEMLNQVPLPKAVNEKKMDKKTQMRMSAAEKRVCDTAGGYSHNKWFEKCAMEMEL